MKTMKKTLLALAVASLPGIAAAQSSVQLYGLVDGFVGAWKTNGNTKTVVDSSGMTTSFWGISGKEDLGGGLSLVFALEAFLRNDVGAPGRFNGDNFFARSAYVGMSGGLGTLTLGRNTAPHFLSTIIFNPFGDSFVFAPIVWHSLLGTSNPYVIAGDTGTSNSIRYQSPSLGGFKLDVNYGLSERDTAPKGSGRKLDVSGFYFGGPLAATLSYRDLNQDTATTEGGQKTVLGGVSYDLKVVKLFGQYQTTKIEVGPADTKAKTFQVGLSAPVGPGSLMVSLANSKYTVEGGAVLATGEKRTTWAVGYDYFVSKRTDVYVAFTDDKFKNPESFKQQIFGLGVRHRF